MKFQIPITFDRSFETSTRVRNFDAINLDFKIIFVGSYFKIPIKSYRHLKFHFTLVLLTRVFGILYYQFQLLIRESSHIDFEAGVYKPADWISLNLLQATNLRK